MKTKINKLPSILSLTYEELMDHLVNAGFEKYRSQQIYQFLYQKGVKQFSDIINIPKKLIDYLESSFTLHTLNEIDCKVSKKEDTYKYLFQLSDGLKIESVVIKEFNRNTLCISSQVGCPLNCVFCLTGKMGIERNLKTDEIIDQFLYLKEKHESIDNIVFMGMGEPFLNYNNLIKAIRIFNSKDGLNFSIRRITISTAGIIKGIRRFANEELNLHLAVSLNSPFQSERLKIMPFTKKNTLGDLLSVCKYYQEKTGRRITFEYVMIKNVNIDKKDAKRIIQFSEDIHFNLNLIPYNPIPNCDYVSPTKEEIFKFIQYFKYSNVEVVQRKRKGRDISAACGQLATSHKNTNIIKT
ncbi:MAG: 23S rRNA (adenine(2503)-C(2))-methyltransferase RlmN [Spirochaetota bacterium]|nr:23S rRNA (adenine(2503)-C(2))-methyltransferase RlmN [Spirochaetota bacterium]